MSSSKWQPVWLILTLIILGLNLRPSMAAIGPLLEAIRASLPLSYSSLALLTMLPVMTMGVAMFIGAKLAAKLGERQTLLLSLLLIGLANLARLWAGSGLQLLLTAIIAGLGIALIQALLPGMIKRSYSQHIERYMGIYVTAIMGGAALAAAISPWLEHRFGHWQSALAFWALLSLPAMLFWFWGKHGLQSQGFNKAAAKKPSGKPGVSPSVGIGSFSRIPRAWLLGLFFGLSTASYTCVLAWLAPFFIDLGWQATQAGLLLAFLTLMEVVAGLLLPTLAARSHDRRPLLLLLLLSTIGGFIGLALMPLALPWLWAALLGIGIGGLFPLSLIVTLDHLDDYSQAGQLTAFVQGIGYLLASLSPLLAGYLKDSSSSFTLSWLLLAAVSLGMLAIVWRFDPKRHSQHFAMLAH